MGFVVFYFTSLLLFFVLVGYFSYMKEKRDAVNLTTPVFHNYTVDSFDEDEDEDEDELFLFMEIVGDAVRLKVAIDNSHLPHSVILHMTRERKTKQRKQS